MRKKFHPTKTCCGATERAEELQGSCRVCSQFWCQGTWSRPLEPQCRPTGSSLSMSCDAVTASPNILRVKILSTTRALGSLRIFRFGRSEVQSHQVEDRRRLRARTIQD